MKKFLLPGLLLIIIGFVLLEIIAAGDTHVVVVEDNMTLASENGKLKTENKKLKSENSKLAELNNKLSSDLKQVTVADPYPAAASTSKTEDALPKAVITIEQEIDAEMGWCTTDIAYDLLEEKLGKKPTKEQYKYALLDLLKRNMLYHPGEPDPYVKANKVTIKEIENLTK